VHIVVKKFTFAISSPDEFLFCFTDNVIRYWTGLKVRGVGGLSHQLLARGEWDGRLREEVRERG